jgi:hypothetical protein
MSYHVTRTINGRRYHYLQRSVREGRKVRTEYIYLGPAEAGARKRKGMLASLAEELQNAVKKSYELTDEQIAQELARQTAEYKHRDHINGLLTAETISLQGINEIAEAQKESPAGEGKGSEGAGTQ